MSLTSIHWAERSWYMPWHAATLHHLGDDLCEKNTNHKQMAGDPWAQCHLHKLTRSSLHCPSQWLQWRVPHWSWGQSCHPPWPVARESAHAHRSVASRCDIPTPKVPVGPWHVEAQSVHNLQRWWWLSSGATSHGFGWNCPSPQRYKNTPAVTGEFVAKVSNVPKKERLSFTCNRLEQPSTVFESQVLLHCTGCICFSILTSQHLTIDWIKGGCSCFWKPNETS